MKIATKDELVSKLKYATALLNASEARENELRECLGELLILKNIHDWWDNLHDVDRTEESQKVIEQYKIEKPKAWAKAKKLLGKTI